MENFDAIIIGGGASGCMCALSAAPKGKKILVIDDKHILGKKLLVTGNGRCNLSNLNIFPSKNYYNQDIDSFLNRFTPRQTLNFFEKLGLVCVADNEGRLYPISNSAKSVVDVINNSVAKFDNLRILLDTTVSQIEAKESYIVKTNNGIFSAKQLVVATAKTGELLKNFDIDCRECSPSLVALKTESTKNLDGIRVAPVKISVGQFENTGEILFKDSGISGIVAFNISSYFARKNKFLGEIFIDFMPKIDKKALKSILLTRKELNLPINKMFDGMMLPQLAYLILNRCKLDENRTTLQLKDDEIDKLTDTIKNFKMQVKGYYENNQVISGGVKLTALSQNLESKKYRGLYFCGEVCDVDGLCGGYNLQWAWTSGHIVGEML